MDRHTQNNLSLWNEWAELHVTSAFYDVPGFKAGRSGLTPLELAEVGSVAGKELLHLQCHFGMGTLTWVRQGAQATGVDFSDHAIALAQSLSTEMNLPARFICSDIYELPDVLPGQFDIVFTSFGVLAWLSDLTQWGSIIANYLKPGGFFYIAEFHPIVSVFGDAEHVADLHPIHPYFFSPEPQEWEVVGSYAVGDVPLRNKRAFEWNHSLSEIVMALIDAGLRIDFLHEFSFCAERALPCLEEGIDGWWRLRTKDGSLPLMFSLKASKPSP